MVRLGRWAAVCGLALAPVPVLSCGGGTAYAFYQGNTDCQAKHGVPHAHRSWTGWDDDSWFECQNLDAGRGNIRSVYKSMAWGLCTLYIYTDRYCKNQLATVPAKEYGCKEIPVGGRSWDIACDAPDPDCSF